MNHKTTCAMRISLTLLVGAAFYLGGCGPDNLDDPTYLAQMNDNAADKEAAPEAGDAKPMEGAMPEGQPEGQPAGGPGPVAAPAIVPAAVVKLPPRFVQLPGAAVHNPPVVTQSGEVRPAEQDVFIRRDIHVFNPAINKHNVHHTMLTRKIFQDRRINHSSFRNVVTHTNAFDVTAERLPTVEITTPTVYGGTIFGGYVGGIGPGYPGCARYLSGGFHRFCAPRPGLVGAGPLL